MQESFDDHITEGTASSSGLADEGSNTRRNPSKGFWIALGIACVSLCLLSVFSILNSTHDPDYIKKPQTFRDLQVDSSGKQLMVLSIESTEDLTSIDSTNLMYSNNAGVSWELHRHIALYKISINWTTGEGIAIGRKKEDTLTKIYYVKDYGRIILPSRYAFTDLYDINMDWKSGRGIISGSSTSITTDYGKTWKQLHAGITHYNKIYADWNSNKFIFLGFRNTTYSKNLKDYKFWTSKDFRIDKSLSDEDSKMSRGDMGYIRNAIFDTGLDHGFFNVILFKDTLPKNMMFKADIDWDSMKLEIKGQLQLLEGERSFSNISNQSVFVWGLNKIKKFDTADLKWTYVDTSFSKPTFMILTNSSKCYAVGNDKDYFYYSKNWGEDWIQKPFVLGFIRPYNDWIILSLTLLVISLTIAGFYLYQSNRVGERLQKDNTPRIDADNPTEYDSLGFSPTTGAIVKLLKSKNSKPPITIALSGAWGKGKSSFMKQVRAQLDADKQFVTIWFNVWHYKSEEHILTSFFTNLFYTLGKWQSVYTFKRLSSIVLFKVVLIYCQFEKLNFLGKVKFFTGLFIVLYVFSFTLHRLLPETLEILSSTPYTAFFIEGSDKLIKMAFSKPTEGSILILAINFIAWIAGFVLLKKEWMPSGLGKIFEIIPFEKFKFDIMNHSPSLRENFKNELWLLIKATNIRNKKIVVFIDDLDRISGDKMREMLETINFITDTASQSIHSDVKPNIIFILAMSLDEVLEKLGKEIHNSGNPKEDKEKAVLYIEKLVDLIVPIPNPNHSDVSQFLKNLLHEK